MTCEECTFEKESVVPRKAMTAYYWDGTGKDPNRDRILCADCYEGYKAYWNEMWDQYYSSQGWY